MLNTHYLDIMEIKMKTKKDSMSRYLIKIKLNIFIYIEYGLKIIKKYIWYGQYKIVDKKVKIHTGKDKKLRKIIILSLKRLNI